MVVSIRSRHALHANSAVALLEKQLESHMHHLVECCCYVGQLPLGSSSGDQHCRDGK